MPILNIAVISETKSIEFSETCAFTYTYEL